MSDPEREDLLIQDSLWPPDDYRKVTDAEFDAIVDADPRWVRAERLDHINDERIEFEMELAEWERLGVKVWQDCPNKLKLIAPPCDTGCPICGGSGKVPAEGVERLEPNAWHRHGAWLIHDDKVDDDE